MRVTSLVLLACIGLGAIGADPALAQAQYPLIVAERGDADQVFQTLTTFGFCGIPSGDLKQVDAQFTAFVKQHGAQDLFLAKARQAATAYRDPQARAFLCGKAKAMEPQMIAGARSSMAHLQAQHAHFHHG